ncbi:MAG: hypothetical protein PWR24_1699 [Desulfonauticus sp.]|jgi:hypothetical protein|nr:MAG: Conserved protein, VrlQ family [Desulfonauticus sp. 38_4375]MDK2922142.1 hypothetical protein [Desulfonauticus sp.]
MKLYLEKRYNQIGIDRIIRLEWLSYTASLVMAGNNKSDIKSLLQKELQEVFRSANTKVRGSLSKTITILMNIWVHPPFYLHSFQQDGLRFLSCLPQEDHIAVHWGMTMAAYPFWGKVASHVGRLLKLQGTASHAQVRRRVMEQFGQRPTVKDAVRRILRSMWAWGVINEAKNNVPLREKGIYVPGLSLTIENPELIAWLIEAFLYACGGDSVDLRTVLDSPILFPFRLSPISAVHLVSVSNRLDMLSHGLDQELIILRSEIMVDVKKR